MPSVEELLSQNSEETYANIGIEYCTVDDDTRMVTVPDKYKKLGVESDEKAKRIWFRFPKLVGNNGVDLSAIGVRVNFRNANGEGDIYIVEDLTTDGDYVTFSWELTRKVTAYKGNVSFVVCAVKSNTDGTTKNEWNTTLNKECEVLEGLEVAEQIEQENPDIIEYILAKLDGSISSEEVKQIIEEYMEKNPQSGMTDEERKQLQKNTEDISKLSEQKVDYNQGVANVGKILVVGADGNITLTDMPSGGSDNAIGYVDENNNIILSGLPNGTYVLKYENINGTYSDICTYVVGGVVQYSIATTLTECTPVSGNASVINEGGTVTLKYVAKDGFALTDTVTVSGASYTWDSTTGTLVLSNPTADVTITITATKSGVTNIIDTVGYTNGARLNSSGGTTALDGFVTTGMIDTSAYAKPATIRTKGVNFNYNGYCYLVLYDSSANKTGYTTFPTQVGNSWSGFTISADDDGNITMTASADASNFFRISGYGSGENLIMTINEEIPE